MTPRSASQLRGSAATNSGPLSLLLCSEVACSGKRSSAAGPRLRGQREDGACLSIGTVKSPDADSAHTSSPCGGASAASVGSAAPRTSASASWDRDRRRRKPALCYPRRRARRRSRPDDRQARPSAALPRGCRSSRPPHLAPEGTCGSRHATTARSLPLWACPLAAAVVDTQG
jgi:hypothetical protein